MYLYHGSPFTFDKPSLVNCKPYRDFGRGFYLAENYNDAIPMAIKNSHTGYLHTYVFDESDDLETIILDGYSDEWLDLVVKARLGIPPKADLVIGNMAGGGKNLKSKFSKLRNDGASVQNAASLMCKELTNAKLGIQYAFLTPKALSRIELSNIEIVLREDVV